MSINSKACRTINGLRGEVLSKKFYARSSRIVAKELLNCILCNMNDEGITAGRIIETEAYLSKNDPANHCFKGITKRNQVMFGPAGHAYIYFIYGMYYCFNIVTGMEGLGEAVLIRALEPLLGIELMHKRRGCDRLSDLTNGPAKLVQALGISDKQNGHEVTTKNLFVLSLKDSDKQLNESYRQRICVGPRIGINQGVNLPLRFYLKDNRYVSSR